MNASRASAYGGEASAQDAAAQAQPAPADPSWPSSRVAWTTMVLIGLVTVFGQFDRAVFYLTVTPIKQDLGLSDTQMSLLMGLAFSGAYFLFGLPIARWTDVGTRKFILPAALATWSAGTAFCALSGNFVQLFLARSLVGGGESVKGPCSVSLISDLFPRDRMPRAFAFYNFCIRGGDALGQIIAGLLIGFFASLGALTLPFVGTLHGWHMVFLSFGLPGLVVALIFVLVVKEPARHGRKVQGSVPIRDVMHFLFRSPSGKVLVPILLSSAILMIETVGIGSWRPAFYERTYGWTPAQFAPIIGTGTLVLTPIGLVIGAWLTERMSRAGQHDANMRIVLWSHILGLPLGIAGPLMPTFELAIGMSFLGVLLTVAAGPAQLAAMQVVTPNELRGQVNALYMFTVSVLGQGLGPLVVALMTDFLFQSENDLRYAMVTAVAIAGPIALYLIWRSLKPYGEACRQSMAAE